MKKGRRQILVWQGPILKEKRRGTVDDFSRRAARIHHLTVTAVKAG